MSRGVTAGVLACVAGLLALPAGASAQAIQHFTPGRVIDSPSLPHHVTQSQVTADSSASTSFPQFSSSVSVGSTTYDYTMVGKNPATAVSNAATTVDTKLIPVKIVFSDGNSWTPSVKDSCDAGATPLSRVTKSPVFVKETWTWGGTTIGTGQITDAFQRANFWTYAHPGGVNPSYAINLSNKTLSAVTITVPAADAAEASTSCGNDLLAAVNINWLDPYLQSTVIPALASKGVTTANLPIFLLHNVVEYVGSTSDCCVLGYHNAYSTSSGIQTYAVTDYDNSAEFDEEDIGVMTHEVAEWTDDPYTNNPTPAWGHIGQVSGCQDNLEVGDPLSGTTYANTINGFTYHPQELAFFSWFYHQSPSLGVNGWYSDQGTFTTFAKACS